MAVVFLPLAIEGVVATCSVLGLAAAGVAAAGVAAKAGVAVADATATLLSDLPLITTIGGGNRPDPPRRPPPPPGPVLKKAVSAAFAAGLVAGMIKNLKEKMHKDKPNGPCCWAAGDLAHYQNQFDMDLLLKAKHQWSGRFTTGPPQNPRKVVEGQLAATAIKDYPIVHEGAPPTGSKAALAYSANGFHWILAWHVPLNSGRNKIYIESGKDSPIDWNVIEQKLDASSNKSKSDLGYAEINEVDGGALIAAVFWT